MFSVLSSSALGPSASRVRVAKPWPFEVSTSPILTMVVRFEAVIVTSRPSGRIVSSVNSASVVFSKAIARISAKLKENFSTSS